MALSCSLTFDNFFFYLRHLLKIRRLVDFMFILGINAYHGDAAAAIIRDGKLIAAVEEERFNRVKHCAGFPTESVKYCLSAAGIRIEDVEHIGISRDPAAHLHKKILFAAQRAAKGSVGGGK